MHEGVFLLAVKSHLMVVEKSGRYLNLESDGCNGHDRVQRWILDEYLMEMYVLKYDVGGGVGPVP